MIIRLNKSLFLLTFLFLFYNNIFSQERIDGPEFKFKTIGINLNEAVGWRFDYFENKWIKTLKDTINFCPRENKTQKVNNNLYSSAFFDDHFEEISYPMNFYSLFFTKIDYKKKTYFILNIVSQKKEINDNQDNNTYISSFIFDSEQFLQLKNFKTGYSYYWKFSTPIKDINIDQTTIKLLEFNTKEALLRDCQLNIDDCNAFEPGGYAFQISVYGNSVRFILPFECLYCEDLKNEFDFNKAYFETDIKKMKSIFEL
jgi:hypothetical protein